MHIGLARMSSYFRTGPNKHSEVYKWDCLHICFISSVINSVWNPFKCWNSPPDVERMFVLLLRTCVLLQRSAHLLYGLSLHSPREKKECASLRRKTHASQNYIDAAAYFQRRASRNRYEMPRVDNGHKSAGPEMRFAVFKMPLFK